jgi:FtsP/CotA-like multicopper oxidase with cupredoxin domain
VSVNYAPVNYPEYTPAVIKMQEGSQEFWRVVNAGANTIMDIQVTYDGVAQPLQVVAFDGVPTGSKDGKRKGSIVTQYDILLSPAARAEFVIAAPASQSTKAVLKTLAIDGGPIADSNPARPLATIVTTKAPVGLPRMPAAGGRSRHFRFDDLVNAKVTATRKLIFSEFKPPVGGGDKEGAVFYITVKGKKEKPFDPNEKPRIVTTRGAVEEWTIFNHSAEVHEFHIHQIHFLVEEVNGVKIPKDQQQIYDTFQVPYKQGFGRDPYIKIKLDFRGPTVGDFVYHCHILDHEDAGMMAKIRVLPRRGADRRAQNGRTIMKSASASATASR